MTKRAQAAPVSEGLPEMIIEMASLDARHLLTRWVPCGHESDFVAPHLASPVRVRPDTVVLPV